MIKNLRGRTLAGLFWNLTERLGIQIVSFIPTILLARLLSPAQFGLIGMLTLFTALAGTFLDSGFGTALIQKKDATYTDECSIFYFNTLVGIVLVVILFFLAPLIAAFYNQPILTGLMRWLSLDILINSFSLIQTTLLIRKLDFKTQLKANLFASLASGVFGVAAAYLGLGVWSLVVQTVSETFMATLTLWFMSDWRPAWIFSFKSLRELFGFGSRMLLSSLVSTGFDNLYQVFIGKVFSAASLGNYTRASSMKGIVIDTTSDTVGRVLYPALSTLQDSPVLLRRAYRKSLLLTTFIHFPMMVGLIVIASPLINLLFTAKWVNSVIFFQLMCAAGILYPLHVINLDVLKVKGRSDLFFRLTVLKRSLQVVILFVTYRWGISAMLIGQIFNSIIAYGLNSYYSERLIEFSVKDQLLDVFPSFLISVLMGAGAWFVGRALHPSSNLLLLVIEIGVGGVLYLLLHFIGKTEPLTQALNLVKQLMVRVNPKGGLA